MNETRPNRAFFRVTDEKLKLLNQRVKGPEMTQQDWLLFKVISPDIQPVDDWPDDYDPFDDDELQVKCKDGSYHLMNEKTEV